MTKLWHSNPAVNHKEGDLGWALPLGWENWNSWETWAQWASWWQISAQQTIIINILVLLNISLRVRMWRVIAFGAKDQLPKKRLRQTLPWFTSLTASKFQPASTESKGEKDLSHWLFDLSVVVYQLSRLAHHDQGTSGALVTSCRTWSN